ncbi:MAG: hypothetical protein K2W82_12285 [Candidatus Obscuribacterales bacterium]|nr:hypothetical protein [Candidatus Obscuribacterales bacterium]
MFNLEQSWRFFSSRLNFQPRAITMAAFCLSFLILFCTVSTVASETLEQITSELYESDTADIPIKEDCHRLQPFLPSRNNRALNPEAPPVIILPIVSLTFDCPVHFEALTKLKPRLLVWKKNRLWLLKQAVLC